MDYSKIDIGLIKDIIQILFFIVVGLVTILSFFQAKKSLFTPLKTETFKIQIETFKDLLLYFRTKTENDFEKAYDFEQLFYLNTRLMVFDYINVYSGDQVKVDKKEIEKINKEFENIIVTGEWMDKFSYTHESLSVQSGSEDKPDSEYILPYTKQNWKDYKYEPLGCTKKYESELNKLNQLTASPFLPSKISKLLEDFKEIIEGNLYLVQITLDEIAQILPTEFTTVKSIDTIDEQAFFNRYMEKYNDLEPKAIEIANSIKQYLKTDKIYE